MAYASGFADIFSQQKDNHIFLFSDLLVIARRGKKDDEFSIKLQIPLSKVKLIWCDDGKIKNGFQLEFDNTTASLTPIGPNPDVVRQTWFKELKQLIKEFQKQGAQKTESKSAPVDLQRLSTDDNFLDHQLSLEEILSDKDLALYFREFMHQHYNNENLSFYLEVEELKRTADSNVSPKAQEIYNTYFTYGSDFELNIDSKMRKELDSRLANPTKTMFDEIQKATWDLMTMDCVPKFLDSELFDSFKTNRKSLRPTFGRRGTQAMISHNVQQRKKTASGNT